MKIVCNSCEQAIVIDDAKVPAGTFRIKCSQCGNLITVQRDSTPTPAPATTASAAQQKPMEVETLVKSEVAAAKKEILRAIGTIFGVDPDKLGIEEEKEFGSNQKRALICENDQAMADQISEVLKRLGYQIEIKRTSIDALKRLDQENFQVITVNSIFPEAKDGGAKILARINGQKPEQRRQTFVVLIAGNVKTSDSTAAFLQGANILVNKDDLGKLDTLIHEGQRHFQQIYHQFSRLIEEKERLV